MNEYDNVKEALKALIELTESERICTYAKGNVQVLASQEDVLEMFRERAYNIADLLGMEDLYLKDIKTRRDRL